MEAAEAGRSEAAQLYQERDRRLKDAIALRVPDRVPVVLSSAFWPTAYYGHTVREAMYDYPLGAECWRRVAVELQPDGVMASLANTAVGPLLDAFGWRPVLWPGHGTPDNVSYQYVDQEIMRADEYDAYMLDPTHFYLTRYLPRVSETLAPLARLPQFPKAQNLRLFPWFRLFGDPDMAGMLQRLTEIGAEAQRLWAEHVKLQKDLADLGFPSVSSSLCPCPYDYFGDYLRGNVPASLLNLGTPDDVTECCKRLIGEVGKNGGFMLDGGGGDGVPDEARPENVRAMMRAVHEFGVY